MVRKAKERITYPQHQVFVKGESPSVDETNLVTIFSECGPVKYVHMKRKRGHFYAFIHYESEAEATAALKFNNTLVGDVLISAVPVVRGYDKDANLFVKGFPAAWTRTELEALFLGFGQILSSKISRRTKEDASNQAGFVQLDSTENADRAIAALNGMEVEGRRLQVNKHIPKDSLNLEGKSIYIKGYSPDYTEERLRERFSEFGTITSVLEITPSSSEEGQSKTEKVALINFASEEFAKAAAENLNGTAEGNYVWSVALYLNKEARQMQIEEQYTEKQTEWKTRNLYIDHLPATISEEAIRELFGGFGHIESAVVQDCNAQIEVGVGARSFRGRCFRRGGRGRGGRGRGGRGRGGRKGQETEEQAPSMRAYVCYEKPEDATTAVSQMNGKEVEGTPIRVTMWKPSNERH